MFTKSIIGLLSLLMPIFSAAQIPSSLSPEPSKSNTSTSVSSQTTNTKTTLPPTLLTIQMLSALQEQDMASSVAKQIGIGTQNVNKNVENVDTLIPPIPVKHFKPVKTKRIYPNLESIVGPEGQENANFRLENGTRITVQAGDRIESWHVKAISNGQVQLTSMNTIQRKRGKQSAPTEKSQWITVGDFIK